MKEINKEYEISCGCIVIDNNKVLLVKHLKGHWDFPKGHMEVGETEMQTAIREVKEETNLDVKINKSFRYEKEYMTDEMKLKRVIFFLAEKTGGEILTQECEVNKAVFVSYEEALKLITYDDSKKLLLKILEQIEQKF